MRLSYTIHSRSRVLALTGTGGTDKDELGGRLLANHRRDVAGNVRHGGRGLALELGDLALELCKVSVTAHSQVQSNPIALTAASPHHSNTAERIASWSDTVHALVVFRNHHQG